MLPLYIAVGTVLFLMALLLLSAGITYRLAFYRNPQKQKSDPYSNISKGNYGKYESISRGLIDGALAMPYEDVYTTSRDGLRLRGRLYMLKEGAPVVIQFHGYKSTPMKDFSGAGVMCREFGYNMIMIDQRAHGESQGRTISFGLKERLDALCWIDYAISRFGKDVKIALQGISMGAATVLLASGEDLPCNVKGIMADCPFSTAEAVLRSEIGKMGLPHKIFYPLLRLGGIIFGKFDASKIDVVAAVRRSKLPILLVHGREDGLVPFYMSEELAATGKCDFQAFDGADHGISYLLDTERYKSMAKSFLENAFGKTDN